MDLGFNSLLDNSKCKSWPLKNLWEYTKQRRFTIVLYRIQNNDGKVLKQYTIKNVKFILITLRGLNGCNTIFIVFQSP